MSSPVMTSKGNSYLQYRKNKQQKYKEEEVGEIKLGYEQRRGGRVKERQKETKGDKERER